MRITNILIAGVLGLGSLPMALADASAVTSLPANSGHAYFGADAACFSNSTWNGISNTCSGSKKFVVTVPNTFGAGSRSFKALTNATQICTSNPTCEAFITSEKSLLQWRSGAQSVCGSVNMGPASAAATDTLHFVCDLPQNASPLTALEVF